MHCNGDDTCLHPDTEDVGRGDRLCIRHFPLLIWSVRLPNEITENMLEPKQILSIASAMASIVSASGIFLLWRQISAEHERGRREKAIEIMNFFISTRPLEEMALSRLLLNELDKKQSELLFSMQDIQIDSKFEEHLRFVLSKYIGSDVKLEENEGLIVLQSTEVIVLRAIVLNLLNTLESMASAWRHNVADREILEDEFCNVVIPRTGRVIFEDFIIASGSYPSLKEFVETIKRKKDHRSNKGRIA